MANFEAFSWGISSSINHLFLKSDILTYTYDICSIIMFFDVFNLGSTAGAAPVLTTDVEKWTEMK